MRKPDDVLEIIDELHQEFRQLALFESRSEAELRERVVDVLVGALEALGGAR